MCHWYKFENGLWISFGVFNCLDIRICIIALANIKKKTIGQMNQFNRIRYRFIHWHFIICSAFKNQKKYTYMKQIQRNIRKIILWKTKTWNNIKALTNFLIQNRISCSSYGLWPIVIYASLVFVCMRVTHLMQELSRIHIVHQ